MICIVHRASLTFKAAFFLFMWKISSFSTFAAFLTCKSRKSPLPPAPKKTPPKNPNPLQAKINKLTFTPPLEATRVSFLLISFGGKRSLLTNDTSVGFYGSSNFCVIIYSLHCSASSRALLFFFFPQIFFFPFLAYTAGSLGGVRVLMGNCRTLKIADIFQSILWRPPQSLLPPSPFSAPVFEYIEFLGTLRSIADQILPVLPYQEGCSSVSV